MKNLVKFMVVDNGEYNDIDAFEDDDYRVFGLYDVDTDKLLAFEDNIHKPIETMINSFIDGLAYSGTMFNVTTGIAVTDSSEDHYDAAAAIKAIKDNHFVEYEF